MVRWQATFCETVGAEIVLGLRAGVNLAAVVIYPCAVIATLMAVDLGDWCCACILRTGDAVCGWRVSVCFSLGLVQRGSL
jgi:hypothetical protein